MNKVKVSIVVPVYNAEKTLRRCLKSLVNQDFDDFEIIVVDNDSDDGSGEIITEFSEKYDFIVNCFEGKRGRGSARLKGESLTKGDIILMTDADCIVPKNWISEMNGPILEGKCDAVQGSEISALNDFWSRHFQYLAETKTFDGKKILGFIDTKNFAISASALRTIGYTSGKYFSGNDTDLSIRMQKNNLKLLFRKNIRVKHFHPCSFRQSVKKQFYRARWCTVITSDHMDYLKNTNFRSITNQTVWGFIKIFPGLIKTLFMSGPGKMYFDLATGLSWRAGLVCGWICNL